MSREFGKTWLYVYFLSKSSIRLCRAISADFARRDLKFRVEIRRGSPFTRHSPGGYIAIMGTANRIRKMGLWGKSRVTCAGRPERLKEIPQLDYDIWKRL